MESLRYLPYLAERLAGDEYQTAFVNIPNYPDLDKVTDAIRALPRKIIIDADELAKRSRIAENMNMVMCRAASPFLDAKIMRNCNRNSVYLWPQGEKIVTLNLKALEAGRAFIRVFNRQITLRVIMHKLC